MGKKYLIMFNNSTLVEYNKYYFEKYPKRRKVPIQHPVHPSLNTWTHVINVQMNNLKQTWDEFMRWLVEKYGYQDLQIEKCKVTVTYYYPTKARHDNDNGVPKLILDSLTHAGVIKDDDYNHLNPLIIYGAYDKIEPRTEILIEDLQEDI